MLEEGQSLDANILDPVCGVYEIRNTVTGRCYIGQSMQIQSRWATHFTELSKGSHSLLLFQQDWDEHGADSFTVHVVRTVDDPSDLLSAEDEVAQDRLDAEIELYNAAIAGWRNEAEQATRARRKAREQLEERILQRKQARENEKRNPGSRHRGNEDSISGKGNIPGSRGLSGDSTSTPMEGDKRGVRVEEAGLRTGKQGSDRETGAEGPAQQGVDEDGRQGKGNRNARKALPIFDRSTAEAFTAGMTEEEADKTLRAMRKDLVESYLDAMEFGLAVRATCTEEELETISAICDPMSVLFHFTDRDQFERGAHGVGHGAGGGVAPASPIRLYLI